MTHDNTPARTAVPTAQCDSADGPGCQQPALRFKPVTLADLPLINSLLQQSLSRTCDYTVGGIFMWTDWFDYRYCVVEDTLFLCGRDECSPLRLAFSLPIGPMPFERAAALIRHYCTRRGIDMVFSAIPEDRIDYMLSTTAGGSFVELEGWGDYLYSAEALATLTGKKLARKRNHFNRFMTDHPRYTFTRLSPADIDEVTAFLERLAIPDDKDPAMACYERDRCLDVLSHFASYPFEGMVLRTAPGGPVAAFTIGEVIGDTLYVHIEKMDHDVAGAGETVNKLFAAEMLRRHCGLRYINREEDVNDPGLRKAKESYCPVTVLRKFDVTFNI